MKGSIEKRGLASWRLTVDTGVLEDGTRARLRKTITVEDPALLRTTKRLQDYLDEQLVAFKREIESGEYSKPEKFTFREFVENKYPLFLKKQSPNTIATYEGHLKKHITPYFGRKQMGDIKTLHCVDYMETIDHYATSTKLCHYTILKSVFKQAMKWGVIGNNPMNGVDRPKGSIRSTKYYDTEQAQKALELLHQEPTHWRLFFTACMIGGFRRGEMLALTWDCVDFINRTISIEKALAAGQVIKSPKSTSSIRKVTMPTWFMDDLKEYKQHWDTYKSENTDIWEEAERDFVFQSGTGKAFFRGVPTRRWKAFTTRHSIPHIRLHDLRHTAATLLLEADVSLKVIQERHGHADFQTTANIYSHVTKKLAEDAADKLEKFCPQSVPNPSHS